MLPQATRLETLNLCTNPYACTVGGADILGCSGQNVDDLLRYVDGNASRHGSLACSPLTSARCTGSLVTKTRAPRCVPGRTGMT